MVKPLLAVHQLAESSAHLALRTYHFNLLKKVLNTSIFTSVREGADAGPQCYSFFRILFCIFLATTAFLIDLATRLMSAVLLFSLVVGEGGGISSFMPVGILFIIPTFGRA